jgi:cytosine/adenosine deaminase-related metal-dependent hydrolase
LARRSAHVPGSPASATAPSRAFRPKRLMKSACEASATSSSLARAPETRCAEKLEGKLRLANELDARTSDRIAIGISPHSIYTSNRQTLELCAGLDIPVSLHLAETRAETEYSISGTGPIADMRARMGYAPMASGLSPVRYLSETGLLRPGACLAHCVHVTSEEAGLIAGSGACVAHCARSNAYLGVGIAPLVGFLEADAVVGLGSDSAASCGRLDFFEEIRFALALQRAGAEDAGVLTAKSVLNLATMGGAAALGLSDRIGSLEPGKRADMIAVDVGDMLPGADPWLTVISKSPADVRMTLVDGAEIARDGLPDASGPRRMQGQAHGGYRPAWGRLRTGQ